MKATGQLSASLAGAGAAVVAASIKAKLIAAMLILGSAGVVTTIVMIARNGRAGQTVYLDPTPSDAGGKSRAQQPPAPSGPIIRPAFKVVSAGSYDEAQGTRVVGGFVGYINKGDWLCYNRVDLGPAASAGGTTFTAQVACPQQFAGNMIEVRQDSLDGLVLATLTVKSTGGHVWRTQSAPAAAHSGGIHDLFLRFSGGGWNLDTFHFTPSARPALGPIDAVGFNEANGLQIRQGVLCEIGDGHWARYNGLDFDTGARAIAITYACDNTKAGGEISVHLDNLSGPAIARLQVTGTGSAGRFVTRLVLIEQIAGRHDVVVAFSGSAPIAKVSRIEFVHHVATAPSTKPATNPATLPVVPR